MTRLTGLAVRTIDYLEWRHQFEAATAWRRDHKDTPALWRWFRVGALHRAAYLPPPQQAAIRAALTDAETALPYPKDH